MHVLDCTVVCMQCWIGLLQNFDFKTAVSSNFLVCCVHLFTSVSDVLFLYLHLIRKVDLRSPGAMEAVFI